MTEEEFQLWSAQRLRSCYYNKMWPLGAEKHTDELAKGLFTRESSASWHRHIALLQARPKQVLTSDLYCVTELTYWEMRCSMESSMWLISHQVG